MTATERQRRCRQRQRKGRRVYEVEVPGTLIDLWAVERAALTKTIVKDVEEQRGQGVRR
jgi:hypothetical protein